MAQRFNSDFKNTIVDLYTSGKGPTELSREYGISVATVYKWINKNEEIKVDSETITNNDVIALKREISRLKEENEILKKLPPYSQKKLIDTEVIFIFMEDQIEEYDNSLMCRILEVPRSSFYYYCKHNSPNRKLDNEKIKQIIFKI